ncbi:hypothetical protein HHK36_007624 [Tetracentron sinense]|uniref:SAM domain-containing protein n=1 Tax=Tetracentron sinense TaxID=13715 RepID=A0A834ZJ93_TETSI|nr:hypothetical protein HHK36_007624 [Tetracentron sinense]
MAELKPPEGPLNGGAVVVASSENLGPCLVSKRQRRPSVRLGDIGDQPATLSYDSYVRRSMQPPNNDSLYRHPSQKDAARASKTRPLVNLVNGRDFHETLETEDRNFFSDGNWDSVAIGNWKVRDSKAKRGGGLGTKRVRSNWASKVDEGAEGDEKFGCGEDRDEDFRDFDPEGSESPLKEQSPIYSLENRAVDLGPTSERGHGNDREGLFHGQKRLVRTRVLESRDHDAIELDVPSDTDARDWKCGTNMDRNGVRERGRCQSFEDGVQVWLDGLGLGRYAPVFEIHDVDDEVLPLLTLEDLKDMGINAVGTRRKMYCAIQKIGKGLS